ncbi:MAG: GAF domain-containing sensor histidine kinase, partial [Mycobacteriales bacterium]
MTQSPIYWILAIGSSFSWPLSLGYVLLQDRPQHLDLAARRVIAGTVATISLVAIYLVITEAFSSLQIASLETMVILAALAGFWMHSLISWVNQRVDKVFYGERARPYEVVRGLAARLRDGLSPAEVPDIVCQTVVHTLRLPAAAVEAQTRERPHPLALVGVGEIGDLTEWFELCYRGTTVGRLWVQPRQGQPKLDDLDRKVLQSLADQAAPAVAGLQLLEELRGSRERLVAAREEERFQLRRELHDGIGPMLAGVRLQLDTARAALSPDSAATSLLQQAASNISIVVSELRSITNSLRPPLLDQLGLAGAVRELVTRLSSPTFHIHLRMPPDLSGLPAAVEV